MKSPTCPIWPVYNYCLCFPVLRISRLLTEIHQSVTTRASYCCISLCLKILESSWALIILWLEAAASLDRSVLPFVGVPSQEPAGECRGFMSLLHDYNGGPLISARGICFNIALGWKQGGSKTCNILVHSFGIKNTLKAPVKEPRATIMQYSIKLFQRQWDDQVIADFSKLPVKKFSTRLKQRLLLWSVHCHTAGFGSWTGERICWCCADAQASFTFFLCKASIVSLDITTWHQYISETQLGNPSCSRETSASIFSTNFVRMAQLLEITPEVTCLFSRRCTAHELSWFILQLEFPPPNLIQWRVAV